ncbi:response regulator [Colwellia psychrerythraea]|uniref:DNA-binding response regulator n=1 Tax=Colwellia psychrerythraea (strain 34H / ATCC BAA-681) TaxID=167879 RepID=Q485A8_COLP3|nr:response regulator [Colwellia psychrerythraea]AAZ26477.1 DNA-binding response regulator [Colwellia psychrerythraea 34H]
MNKLEKLLTPAQVGKLLSVSPITVRFWAKEGRLKFTTTPGGHRRFELSEVENLVGSKLVAKKDKTIIIVEDDKQHADLLVEFIEVLYPKFEVKVAYSGFEAGSMIEKIKPSIIFLDLVMPDIDGFAVCKHIRSNEASKNTPIIAMSGLSQQENIEKVIASGANTFLMKPIRLSVLKQAVDSFIVD